VKERYHPKAFLTEKRNVRLGLIARSRIARFLEEQTPDVKTIAKGEQARALLFILVGFEVLMLTSS